MIAMSDINIAGIGMTSQRTRDRMRDRLREKGISDERVLNTMAAVPRHLFVDEAMATRAYEDVALPIGEGQTISQPYVVARMTELAVTVGPGSGSGMTGSGSGVMSKVPQRVLEVGTGSGYQAAILSQLVDTVFTVERIQTLLHRARDRFRMLGYKNIHTRYSDGSWGWASNGPYDCIVVTAAPSSVPDALLDQLAIGGRMIIPVGEQRSHQKLTIIERTVRGFQQTVDNDVRFVPFLTGKS